MIMDGSLKFENLNILSHVGDPSTVMTMQHKNDGFSISMNKILWELATN